jgi:hypothetical protein
MQQLQVDDFVQGQDDPEALPAKVCHFFLHKGGMHLCGLVGTAVCCGL